MASESPKNKSPVLTIKRAGRQHNGQWQDFIDREQSSVDHLMKDSFATLCREFKENTHSAIGRTMHHTIGGYKVKSSKRSPISSNRYEKSVKSIPISCFRAGFGLK